MAEIRTVTTLKSKREESQFSIRLYEDRIKQARADPAHVMTIRIFEASGDRTTLHLFRHRFAELVNRHKGGL